MIIIEPDGKVSYNSGWFWRNLIVDAISLGITSATLAFIGLAYQEIK